MCDVILYSTNKMTERKLHENCCSLTNLSQQPFHSIVNDLSLVTIVAIITTISTNTWFNS